MKNKQIVVFMIYFLLLCACQPDIKVQSPETASVTLKQNNSIAPEKLQTPQITSEIDVNLSATLMAAINSSHNRSQFDATRDENRKPAEVLVFLGLQPGMTVLDIFAGGGWYSEVISASVGPEGKVYIQNPPRVLAMRNGEIDKELTTRLANNRLSNAQRLDLNIGNLNLKNNSLDMAITALNFHDMVHLMPGLAPKTLNVVFAALKPGGVFGVIDHYGLKNGDNATLHRIHPSVVEKLAEAAGFIVEAESTVLRNSEDEILENAFNAELIPNTSRFVLLLRKPKL